MKLSIIIAAALTLFCNCGVGVDDEEPGLYYEGTNPIKLSVGDTSEVLKFKLIHITDPVRGKSAVINNYEKVILKTDDSVYLAISGLRIIATAPFDSTAIVTATDAERQGQNDYEASIKVKIGD